MNVNKFLKQKLWWQGPRFLREKIELEIKNKFVNEVDKKKSATLHNATEKEDLFLNHNSFNKLVRLFSYVMKFFLYKMEKIAKEN